MKTTLSALVAKKAVAPELAQHLNALAAQERSQEVLALSGQQLSLLFQLVRDKASIELARFLEKPEQTVRFALKNSMPLFNLSEKRFYRRKNIDESKEPALIGYNHLGALPAFFAGPGYFEVEQGKNGELVFDYTRAPKFQPPGWPALKTNATGLRSLVYGGMIDYCWGVGRDTLIGAAYRNGRSLNTYFVITRRD